MSYGWRLGKSVCGNLMSLAELCAASSRPTWPSLRNELGSNLSPLPNSSGLKIASGPRVLSFSKVMEVPSGSEKTDDDVHSPWEGQKLDVTYLFLDNKHLVMIWNKAVFFLDVPGSFPVLGGANMVSLFCQQLHQVVRDVASPHVDRLYAVIQWVTLVQWNTVWDGVAWWHCTYDSFM